MVEVGIFRKELHEMSMRIAGASLKEIRRCRWVNLADGHEVVFQDSNSEIGLLEMVNVYGEMVELYILREWCNDFKPLAEF